MTMQIINHDNSYIVMERGKFLSTTPIVFKTNSVVSTEVLAYAEF